MISVDQKYPLTLQWVFVDEHKNSCFDFRKRSLRSRRLYYYFFVLVKNFFEYVKNNLKIK